MLEYNEEDGGVQFDPYDDELIQKYLIPKLRGEDCGDFIVMNNVYAKEPWLLDHTKGSFFQKNEWYYFVTRTQVSKKKNGCGRNSKRKITGDNDGGNWKATAKDDIRDVFGKIIGKKQTLKFNKSNNNKKKQKRGDGTSCATVRGSDSSWIMTEYMLPEEKKYKFQELILCKIHVINKSNKKDNKHEASTSYHHESIPASSTEKQPININHQTVQSPSLEQQQPLLCGGSRPEIPHMGFLSSLTCSAAETERNREQSGEGNMVHYQIDATHARSQELFLRKIHERKKYKKKDDHHEASTSSYHPPHESFYFLEQPQINIGQSVLASSFSDEQQQQPINEAHRHDAEIPSIGSENNGDQVIFCKIQENNKSKKMDDHHEASTYRHHNDSYTSEQQPMYVDYESVIASFSLEPMYVDYESIRASPWEQQAFNNDYDSVLASSSEQQPINSICEIQENKKDDHEAFIPHHPEFVADSSSEQQPINEGHRYDSEIPHIGSENNDQVFETCRLSDDDTATVKETNGKEKCEKLGSEKDKQLHIGAPLVCLGSEQEAEDEKERERDWFQELKNSLMILNGSGLPIEEDDDILNYDTPFIDQDLLDQYATLRPPIKLSTLGI